MDDNLINTQAKNLTKAIFQRESQMNYKAVGDNGTSTGAGQWQGATWKAHAKDVLGDENAPMTPENQSVVAQGTIRKLIKQGKDAAQIAAIWNSGSDKNWENKIGTTTIKGKQIEYNVPKYVKDVTDLYQKFKSESIPAQSQVTAPPTPQPEPTKLSFLDKALDIGSKVADAVSGGGKIGELIGGLIAKSGHADLVGGVKNTPDEAQYVDLPSAKEVAGSAAQAALNFVPVGKAAKLIGTGAKALGAGEKLAAGAGKLLAHTGAGYGYDVTSGLANNEQNPLTPGIGTALGAGSAILSPVVKAGTGLAKATGRGAANVTKNITEPVVDRIAKEQYTRALPKAEQKLVRSGFDERSTNFLSTAHPETKKGFQEMVDIADKQAVDARYKVEPKQVIGKKVLGLLDTVQQDSVKARNEINAIAKQPKKVDLTSAFTTFVDKLGERGIQVNSKGKLISIGSTPTSELKYYQNALDEMKAVTKGQSVVSNLQAHQLRQRLFATLEAEAKKGTQPGVRPFSDKVDQDVNLFRREIAKGMGKKYQDAAQRFAENESVLRDTAKMAGVPNDWEKLSSKDLKLGEVLLRTLGNAADRPKALLDSIETLAKKRGNTYKGSINDLIDFSDALEELYGISKSRGIEGAIQKGVNQSGINIPTTKEGILMKVLQSATRTRNKDKIEALKGFLHSR